MLLQNLAAVSAIAGIAAGASLPAGASSPGSHGQSPLITQEPQQIIYDVRRFYVASSGELDEILHHAKSYDLDVWRVTQDDVDIYFPESSAIPNIFQSKNSTALSPSWTPISPVNTLANHPYPTIGTWNLTSLHNCSFHNSFHDWLDISSFMQQMAEDYPDIVRVVRIGRTAEGRDIVGLDIGTREKNKKGKPKNWRKHRTVIQGAQHAREWIATSTALYFAHSLLVNKKERGSMVKLLERMDFTIIPVPNPDGYVYTWEHERLWYKNRQDVVGGGTRCKGLDLNRNWGYEWQPGSDHKVCAEWYPGEHAFEALETRAISSYLKWTPNIRAFIDLRSYGQLIMHPFSHSCKVHAKDEENLIEAGLGMAKALTKRHGTHMIAGSLCEKLYSAGGNVIDWVYAEAKVSVAYSVMLRDTGTYGFLLPATMIRPVGEETADMVAYLAKWIKTRHP
ncbi:putative metallocarboxypeptidase ecm14 [Tulasnella sp. 408]|nr:putative metallocarboxypeptidase ecm14 [Tulasnella sp. 408]